jgi:hypothetical protein
MKAKDWLRPSVIALVLSNLVPVFGVLALGWDVFPILLLYWLENVVNGFYNVLRMAWCTDKTSGGWGLKLLLIPFFCVHYGGFCAGQGFFVVLFYGMKLYWGDLFHLPTPIPDPLPSFAIVWQLVRESQLGWVLSGLLISHGVSFVTNYLRRGEYRRAHLVRDLLFGQYSRVIVFNLVIMFLGFGIMWVGSPSYALVVLVLLKIHLDLGAHLAERAKYGSHPSDEPTDWIANLFGRRRSRKPHRHNLQ